MERQIRHQRRAKCAVFTKIRFAVFAKDYAVFMSELFRVFSLLFRRERGDDFFEARIAAQ